MLQTVAASRFDDKVVVPGPIPRVGAHTEQVEAALQDPAASVWR